MKIKWITYLINLPKKWISSSGQYVFCKKKCFCKTHRKTPCFGVSFLIKLQVFILKKKLQHWCFPVDFEKFLRKPFFLEHPQWQLFWISLTYFGGNDEIHNHLFIYLFLLCMIPSTYSLPKCFYQKHLTINKSRG